MKMKNLPRDGSWTNSPKTCCFALSDEDHRPECQRTLIARLRRELREARSHHNGRHWECREI